MILIGHPIWQSRRGAPSPRPGVLRGARSPRSCGARPSDVRGVVRAVFTVWSRREGGHVQHCLGLSALVAVEGDDVRRRILGREYNRLRVVRRPILVEIARQLRLPACNDALEPVPFGTAQVLEHSSRRPPCGQHGPMPIRLVQAFDDCQDRLSLASQEISKHRVDGFDSVAFSHSTPLSRFRDPGPATPSGLRVLRASRRHSMHATQPKVGAGSGSRLEVQQFHWPTLKSQVLAEGTWDSASMPLCLRQQM